MKTLIALFMTTGLGGCAELGRGDPLPDVADTRADTGGADTRDTTIADGETVEGDTAPDTVEETVIPQLSFADDGVHDALIANCTSSGCHGSGAGGFTLSGDVDTDYQNVLNTVTVGDGLASKLVKKASATSSHAGGPVFQTGSAEYQLLVDWIDSGANP